jgi:uracil-DNA glycosylase family 4
VTLDLLAQEIEGCRRCPRLVAHRQQVAREKRRAYRDWEYWGRPVSGFGDPEARLLVVGLAPGAHGANRTGRIFTGDSSGDYLYRALWETGFANQAESVQRGDGLRLQDCYITCAVRCAPPDNRPESEEIERCRPYLEQEWALLERVRVVVPLGRIGWKAVLDQAGVPASSYGFGHGVEHELPDGRRMICSYHPSRQNTSTGRLTAEMLRAVFERAAERIRG